VLYILVSRLNRWA